MALNAQIDRLCCAASSTSHGVRLPPRHGILPLAQMGGSGMNYHGIYRGICVNNLDPLAQGRMQVRVPGVFGSEDASWAMPCRALGSPGAAPPSVGESVWVMFEAGEAQRPVVIGIMPR
jgi:hypothetical protein